MTPNKRKQEKNAVVESESPLKKSSMKDREIIQLLPLWDNKGKFIPGKGVVSGENKLIQYSILGRVRHNWLDGGNFNTRTIMIEGKSVENFYDFLQSFVGEFVIPETPDAMSLKCKINDPLLVLDESKNPITLTELTRDDRVLVTFNVMHWVIKRDDKKGFKFHLLSVRHIPGEPEEKEVIYTGPDF